MGDTRFSGYGGAARWLPLAVIVVVASIGTFAFRDHLGFAALSENREALIAFRDANFAATALVFLAAYTAIVAFSLPGATVATLTGGFLFGLFPGAVFNLVSATAGAVLVFLAVRAGLGDRLTARMDAGGERVRAFRDALRDNEFTVLFSIRLIPLVPFFVANLVPALVGMRLSNFAAATFLGIIPGCIVYTWVGVGLGEVLARGETPDLGIIFEPYILGPLVGLAILAALPMLLKVWKGRVAE